MSRIKEKNALEHAQNALIQIILRMCKVSYGLLLSIHTFCSFQWFCLRTAKALIRLRGCMQRLITKTCLYNFDPLKPHFYIVKLGFTGVYIIIYLISALNIDYGYSLEPPRRAILTSTHNLCFEQKYEKISVFYLKIFSFWRWDFLYIFFYLLQVYK